MSNIVIGTGQAWETVKFVFSSSNYTYDQQLSIFDEQKALTPDPDSSLVFNTCLALSADSSTFDTIYEYFKENDANLMTRVSLAEGWNTPIHLTLLESTYKKKYFYDIAGLSLTLSLGHFRFFYESLAPIDNDLDESITKYQAISLTGRSMLGHAASLKKIAELDKDKDTDIKYNADTGKFTYTVNTRETPQITRSAFVSSQRSVQASTVKIAVDEANKALEMIRSNAQYDEQGFTEEQLVDTMLSRYLPEQLVQGTLKPFVPEEGSEEVSDTQEVLDSEGNPIPLTAESLLRLNQEIIKLKAQVMNQGMDTDNQED